MTMTVELRVWHLLGIVILLITVAVLCALYLGFIAVDSELLPTPEAVAFCFDNGAV